MYLKYMPISHLPSPIQFDSALSHASTVSPNAVVTQIGIEHLPTTIQDTLPFDLVDSDKIGN